MKLSILSRFFQPRAGPNDRRESPISNKLKAFLLGKDVGLGLASTAGIRMNEETAMRVTAVYACVRVIAETVASLPLPLYRKLENPIPKEAGGDFYLVNGNMLPVSLVGSKTEGG